MHGHKGILASELIKILRDLIEKHGDHRVVAACDHDPVAAVRFEADCWIGEPVNESSPAFELDQWF